jgi:tetratricopeptide (TPR) repeat protein
MPGDAGPDEGLLGGRGHEIFETQMPLFSKEECESLISEAKATIVAGLQKDNSEAEEGTANSSSSSYARTNSQLGEARVSQLPKGCAMLGQALRERLGPMLESRYGISSNDIVLYDGLVLSHVGPSQSQPVHRDASLLTINVALSPLSKYGGGGGTYFEGLVLDHDENHSESNNSINDEDGNKRNGLLKMDQGHVMCHSSGVRHAGHGIESGERWVLVLFCLSKSHVELARRCHAIGLERLHQQSDPTEPVSTKSAAAAFQAGLEVAPKDHMLQLGMGEAHNGDGNQHAALVSLDEASRLYSRDPRPLVTAGKILLEKQRPRAALRRFALALDRINDRDLYSGAWMPLRALGFDARLYGAHCTLVCAEREGRMSRGTKSDFARAKLPEAIQWGETALLASPQDERLMGLLARAQQILSHVQSEHKE